jgi:DNA processing protein
MKSDLKYWLALSRISGINSARAMALIKRFGGVKEIFYSPLSALLECKEITLPIARRLKRFSDWDDIEEELRYLKKISAYLIPITGVEYPELLKNIFDPPLLLYCKGNIELLNNKCIAVVGSRHPTDYGREATQKLTVELVEAGYTIVSGFAQGIDTEAHMSAVRAHGSTIAVFGSGIDVIYPAGNEELYSILSISHLMITEFPPGTKPFKSNFPQRNRIISGISTGVLVIEATTKSGSLITARYALEQGRDVFAVPGMITSTRSQGCHYLIKEGARPVESVRDIVDGFVNVKKNSVTIDELNISEEERLIVETLKDGKKHIDIIIESVKMPSSQVAGILTSLEIKNIVTQTSGKYFELKVD